MPAKDFIDFAALKEKVSIAQCVTMLGLQMKGGDQMRSACPQCQSGGDRALAVNTAKGSFYCFAQGKGGDQIALVAHIRDVGQREAAQEIAQHFGIGEAEKTAKTTGNSGGSPQTGMAVLDYLQHDHDAVTVLGFEPDTAQALGIGFAPKGIMRGLVCVPVRLEDGSIAGYIGVNDIAKLPPTWHIPTNNVVELKAKKPA